MLVPTWNDVSEIPDGSYSISDIQNKFEYFIQNQETLTDNLALHLILRLGIILNI